MPRRGGSGERLTRRGECAAQLLVMQACFAAALHTCLGAAAVHLTGCLLLEVACPATGGRVASCNACNRPSELLQPTATPCFLFAASSGSSAWRLCWRNRVLWASPRRPALWTCIWRCGRGGAAAGVSAIQYIVGRCNGASCSAVGQLADQLMPV